MKLNFNNFLISSFLILTLFKILTISTANEDQCLYDTCLMIYNNIKGLYQQDLNTFCSLKQDLKECVKQQSRKCRGDLNFHFLEKLSKDLNKNGMEESCKGGGGGNNNRGNGGDNKRRPGGGGGGGGGGRKSTPFGHGHGQQQPAFQDKCAPKINPGDLVTTGCALYGLTNLKSFSESINVTGISFCSLSGAWSLIDTPEFAVQITNKGGLMNSLPKDITATILVTVIIKNNQCSQRKTYQATFDEIPSMFSDGSYSSGTVYIDTIKTSEQVRIHFPFISSTIDILRITDRLLIPSLSIVIQMPVPMVNGFLDDPDKIRGLPLCMYGCPNKSKLKERNGEFKLNCPNVPPPPPFNFNSKKHSNIPLSDDEFGLLLNSQEEEEVENDSSSSSLNDEPINGLNSACNSLPIIQSILGNSSAVIQRRLSYPGDENFGSSNEINGAKEFNVIMENSALTSSHPPLFYRSLILFYVFSAISQAIFS